MPKEYFDLLVVIPLEEEVAAFSDVFRTVKNYSTKTDFRFGFDGGNPSVSGLVVQQDQMGKSSAARSLRQATEEFEFGLIVCLGIAGSMSSDMKLGDVCYSGSILDVSENNKALSGKDGTFDIEFSPNQYSTKREVTAALNFIRVMPELRPKYLHWQEQQKAASDRLLGIPIIGRNNIEENIEAPISKNGMIVCGPVSRSESFNKKLLALNRKILAIETESGGIFEDAETKNLPALTIRGISDYADDNKSSLEQSTKGKIRRIAASNAATFLKLQYENPHFLEILIEKRAVRDGSPVLPLTPVPEPSKDLTAAVKTIGVVTDAKLRELSPEFRLQPKGYRLPVPRIRQLEESAALEGPNKPAPIEVRDALAAKNILLITIPRTYPDNSLPWILVDDLLTSDIAGKQIIPLVLSGDDIKPPNNTLQTIVRSEYGPNVAQLTDVQPVYVVDGVPFSSKSRIGFIMDQVKQNPDAKFIFIVRGDPNLLKESEFVGKLAADIYSIGQVSFREIAFFIQKNFEMSGSEAEVVALRLRETFNQFALAAHPTYFAGIPRETLSALLQANRRSELIQLAVDGFLTFVVAADKADVTLSRTTRSRFLRKLAVVINVEKQSFSQEQLIAFTRSFSTQYDFDIDPLEFIHSFVEKGILHFENDRVRFSLPFIESYLLAAELKENAEEAEKYFEIGSADFDFLTFDLYSELGASAELVDKVFTKLDEQSKLLSSVRNATDILLTDKIRPALLAKPERIQALQERVRKAIEDVQKNRDDKDQKQQILDVADRIRETAAEKSAGGTSERKSNERIDRLTSALQSWGIGTILLGAGAEHLEASIKQRLSKLLIEIGAMAIDEWSQIHAGVDFEQIKRELTSKASIEKFFGKEAVETKFEEVSNTITGLADILEYSFLGEPFRRIINHLCEHARLRVLAPSVEKAKVSGKVEQIIYGTWLADIEGRRGKDALKTAIKDLPPAPFFRIVLATHFLTRVYWSHWKEEDRLMLLDAADGVLKPVQLSMNKSKILRYVEKDQETDAKNRDDVGA